MSKDMVMLVPISYGLLMALALVSGATLGLVNLSNMGFWIVALMGGVGVLTIVSVWVMLADDSGESWKPPERIHTHTERTMVHIVGPDDFEREWRTERYRS